ncbi:MAG TPA: nucleoside-diphosphate kinase [Methanothermobacter sp.]|nr:nucleoside-diphosphate kinase [Methanothermobacter sp.]HPQ05158.1 nucleoside-diphosphate kinase [Methanothermobacter sp.]
MGHKEKTVIPMEKTFIMLKPDAIKRRQIGKIITRFEEKGLKIVAAKMLHITRELATKHYQEHKNKPFFNNLIDYITSSPVLALVIEGENSIKITRKMVGATNPQEADPGTIRGDLALHTGRNIIHASDSPKSAEREIKLFFTKDEIHEYTMPDENIIYEY